MDVEGVSSSWRPSWRPGVNGHRYEQQYDREIAIADGAGDQILTVVSVHKPGRFPTRVFYTRQWRSPDGVTFGKSRVHIATSEKFRRTATSYQHRWTVEDRGVDAALLEAKREKGVA